MGENSYKIELGVKLKDNAIQSEINEAQKTLKPIEIKVDAETKELTNTIKEALNSLSKGTKNALTLDTTALEGSLREVKDAILDIKNSFGTLDNKSGMKSLLASINQIADTIGKVTDETDTLVKSLNTLSKKEFGFNFNLKTGNANPLKAATDYGKEARRNAIPALQEQASALQNLLGGYLQADKALERYLTKVHKASGISIKNSLIDDMSDTSSIAKQMEAIEKYIGYLRKIATEKGINLSGFDSQFSKAAENIVDDTVKIQTGAKQTEEALEAVGKEMKQIFGGGVSAEGLSASLEPIIVNLGEIRKAVQDLSKGFSLDGLTASFDRLSGSIENLLANAEKVRDVLNSNLGNSSVSGTATVDTTPIKSAQQIGQKVGETVTKAVQQSLNIDDVIDKQVLDLMDRFAISGGKGSDAFNSIKQAVVECRNELNVLKNSDIGIDEEVFDTSRAIDKVSDAIANQHRAVNNLGDEYVKLANYMTSFNDPKKGNKVRLPDMVKQEQGDDYKSNRGSLGIAFNTERGISFVDFINDLNHELGDTISLTNGEAAAMDELLRKVEIGRQQRDALSRSENYRTSTASTEEILEQNGISKEEIYTAAMSAVSVVDEAEQKIAQSSAEMANEVVQSGEKIEQSYRETFGVIENLKTTLEAMRVDRSSIDTIVNDIEELGFTAKNASVEMKKNGKFDITVDGIDDIGRAITEIRRFDSTTDKISLVGRKISQPLAETDKFIKQQKKSVADLTNQINQLNRDAIDQNANRPIKDSTHLDSLKEKYNEIISAIQKMGNASSNTFDDEANNVRTLISEYKSLKKEFKNSENVSSSLKATDFESGLKIAKNNLEKFKAQASDFPQITATVSELDKAIEGVGDKSSLDSFTDQLKVARAELTKVKAETIAANRKEKVGIDVSGATSRIADIQRISPEIDDFKAKINGAEVTVESLLNDLSKVNTAGDFSVVNRRLKAFEEAAKSAGIAVTEAVTKVSSVNKIKIKISDTGFNGFEQEVARAHNAAEELDGVYPELEAALKRLDIAMDGVYSADQVNDIKRLVSANEEYETSLKQVYSQLKLYQQAEQKEYKNDLLQQKKASLSSEMEIWLKENTRAAKDYGEEIRRLQTSLDGLDDKGVKLAGQKFKNLTKEAKTFGKTGLTVFDKLKSKAKEYMAYLSAAEMFMYAEQGLRSMFEQVKLIDSAMTELKKVTDETDESYNRFLTNAADRAKAIGTTIDGLVSSTADFARLGYEFADAQGLAEVANIYAVVGDDIEGVEGATESLISTLTAFKDEMNGLSDSDFALSIVDKMNEVSNNFAISSGGIGEALQRSASSMMAANNSLDETIALITAANTVVQDPASVGQAFKTISMRIRGAKTE